jgi:hypothetical protein
VELQPVAQPLGLRRGKRLVQRAPGMGVEVIVSSVRNFL